MNSRIALCLVAIIVSIILHPITAHARLGETIAQCEARYGKASTIDKDGVTYFYAKPPMFICCKFVNGVCEVIMLAHLERDVLKTPTKMSAVEIDALLEANGKGSTWNKRGVFVSGDEWQTADGLMVAVYYDRNNQLCIMTRAELERLNAAKAAEEKAKLKGF